MKNDLKKKLTWGIIYTIGGIASLLFSLSVISNDQKLLAKPHYTYQPPFSSHEITMIVWAVASIACVVIGIIYIIIYFTNCNKHNS